MRSNDGEDSDHEATDQDNGKKNEEEEQEQDGYALKILPAT